MPHSYIKIWIHAIWATKQRRPYIKEDIEKPIHAYIKNQFLDLGSPVSIVNGMEDHIHALFLLNRQRSIGETIKQIKGSTSHWMNEQKLIEDKFAWQVGYAAFGVDENSLQRIYDYIRTQKDHHRVQDFQAEYEELILESGIDLKIKPF